MTEQDLKDTIIRQATEITELKAQLSNSQFLEKYYRDLHWELKCQLKESEEKKPVTTDDDDIGVGLTD